MNAPQAGLILMLGLSFVDGKVDDKEKEQIAEYASQNFGSDTKIFEAILDMMLKASAEDTLKHIVIAGAYIGAKVSDESKLKMLDFLIRLAQSDGEVHKNEIALISQLKEAWL